MRFCWLSHVNELVPADVLYPWGHPTVHEEPAARSWLAEQGVAPDPVWLLGSVAGSLQAGGGREEEFSVSEVDRWEYVCVWVGGWVGGCPGGTPLYTRSRPPGADWQSVGSRLTRCGCCEAWQGAYRLREGRMVAYLVRDNSLFD